MFALNQNPFTTKQSGKSLSEYYGELTKIFQELDHRDKAVMTNLEDIPHIEIPLSDLGYTSFLPNWMVNSNKYVEKYYAKNQF